MMAASAFDQGLADLAMRINGLLPEGFDCCYDGEPPSLYYVRAIVTRREDGFDSTFIESHDGWTSQLKEAQTDGELRAAALSQLQAVGWIEPPV